MDVPSLVLVHSPLVGPSTWGLVAENLRRGCRKVTVPSLVSALTGRPPLYPALAHAVVAALPAPEAGSVVLVVHSGAGSLVPSVVDEVPSLIAAVIFVDATLPHPGRRWIDTVPAEMADELRGMAGPDGLLPMWHEWFPPEALTELVPDERARAAFCADVPRLPLRYLEEVAPQLTGWRTLPCGYIQLSAAYDEPAADARRAGWPVARVDGHHLSAVTDPAVVAAAVTGMADAW
jgi:hypothetical protein